MLHPCPQQLRRIRLDDQFGFGNQTNDIGLCEGVRGPCLRTNKVSLNRITGSFFSTLDSVFPEVIIEPLIDRSASRRFVVSGFFGGYFASQPFDQLRMIRIACEVVPFVWVG
jgi:hypothetical protein